MFSQEFADGILIFEENHSHMNLKIFEPHLHLKVSITETSSAPYTWWSWRRGPDPDREPQNPQLCPEDPLHIYKQLKDSMDSSGLHRPPWTSCPGPSCRRQHPCLPRQASQRKWFLFSPPAPKDDTLRSFLKSYLCYFAWIQGTGRGTSATVLQL